MNNKRQFLKKSKEVKRGSKSRIEQLEAKMEEEKKLKEEYLKDDNVEDFIEKDFYQEDRKFKMNNKKIKGNEKYFKPKKNVGNKNKIEKSKYDRKLDEESKNLMQNLMKKTKTTIKKNTGTDNNFEAALQKLQKNYNNSESKNKRHVPIKQKKTFLLTSQKLKKKGILKNLEKGRDNLLFFLTEIVPDFKNNSNLYLFGKTKKNNEFINTCIQVKNIMREIYVMPREGNTVQQVEEEIKGLISNSKNKKIDIKFEIVKKKYCFELDVDYRNIETEILKVSFSFEKRTLNWLRQTGKTYKGVFGINNQALELFMLQNKIQGSCWLDICDYTINDSNHKFAPNMLNVEINEYNKSIKMSDEHYETPKFNLCTFEIEYNHNNNQIDAICYAIFYDYDINSSGYKTMDQIIFKKNDINTNFRPINNNENQTIIKEFDNEYQLLANFHIIFANTDPDIIVGHELLSFTMEVYIQRVRAKLFDVDHFSRLTAKQKMKNNENLKYRLRALFPGRLFVDIYELAKTSIKLESYSLYDMSVHFFGKQNQKSDMITKISENPIIILKIADKLKLLPLTLQLSKVAGCLWEMSLRQSRAERNEVLLLNEFYHKNYIIPDRKNYSSKNKSKKSKYSGGKVFDPKINFYDTYVILVDFNSLYPSIIRQFNICFTTVKRNLIEPGYESAENEELDLEFADDQEGPLNQIEYSSETQPLLPLILTRLINKRKLVKRELKKTKNLRVSNKELEVQLDIKQQAYKLIANSIYGCLGFSFSRFYAKKMAMLVTSFGRKLLESSRDLVEKMGFEVIYGDTDSIMINTMKKNLKMAILDGLTMKKEINRQFYKQKGKEQILEVEIDGVYKKMLLLKKKKYAGLMILNFNEIVKSRKTIPEVQKMEIKGLDLVRRDWSKLTKDVSRKVLDIIMHTGGDLIEINSYLETVNLGLDKFGNKNKENENKTKNGLKKVESDEKEEESYNINVGLFIIKRQLNKKTHEYNQSSNYPHVKVAIDMKRLFKKKEEQLINHFIPFIITKEGSLLSEKAIHPSVYMQSQSTKEPLEIDLDWYKKNQLINPLERLLNPIDGFLSESLNKVFGFKVEEREVNTNIDNVNQIYDLVMDNTPLNYRKVPLDFNDYSQKCNKCKNCCYSFLMECQNTEGIKEFNEAEYENRVIKSVSNLVRKYSSIKYSCEDCDFECNMALYSKNCPRCKNESIKRNDSVFIIIGKMLYFRKLCEINIGKSDNRDRFMFVLKHIEDVLKGFEYESRNVLKLFGVYTKQYSHNKSMSLIKLI